jgi:regulator of nucleoside diphosphate kinase
MFADVITLTEKDYSRLKNLLESQSNDTLEEELERASIIKDDLLPVDLVTMNSRFVYRTENDGENHEMSIVFPHEADPAEHKISILAPLGMALLGLKVGQSINWKFPDGKTKTLTIVEIKEQPHAHSELH